jgi:3-hydroxyacyl-CoA dehydrogenase
MRHRFTGVHFFNPPRYMHLVEVIPTRLTDPAVVEGLEAFLVTTVGKGVVIAKDTPNFIGNRIGVFSMLSTMYHTEQFKLGFDTVDALTGPAVGRPKSATYRTADVVGLDTMAHVIKTMADTLADDPWHKYFKAPAWLQGLIDKGALGQKTGAGFYKKAGKDIVVLDAPSRITASVRAESRPTRSPPSSRSRIRPRSSASCAPPAIRRRSSCGPASATCSTTPPITWPTSPTPRATSISRSAGATAGSSARSRPGRLPAGSRSPAGSTKTSPPARP